MADKTLIELVLELDKIQKEIEISAAHTNSLRKQARELKNLIAINTSSALLDNNVKIDDHVYGWQIKSLQDLKPQGDNK